MKPRKQWSCAGHPYLSGEIESARLDVAALGLTPLALNDEGEWDPKDEYWGEEGEPIDEWTKPIIARGPRQAYEMEQVIPGSDPDDFGSDPICKSNDLEHAGDRAAAYKIFMELCQADLRCLDAHAHLGSFVFEHRPKDALRHYEVGVRIGELSLPRDFDGVLPRGHLDNRPFLRCLHGYGLCLWRLERYEDAVRVFDWMLWLNPSDNQGVRFLIDEVRTKTAWVAGEDRREESSSDERNGEERRAPRCQAAASHGAYMKRYDVSGGIPMLDMALSEFMNVGDLKHLAALTKEPVPTRKADLAAVIKRYLDGDRLRKVWQALDELQRAAVAEVVHSSSTEFESSRFQAKYGREPNWGTAESTVISAVLQRWASSSTATG